MSGYPVVLYDKRLVKKVRLLRVNYGLWFWLLCLHRVVCSREAFSDAPVTGSLIWMCKLTR
jgi:hypothetical protein